MQLKEYRSHVGLSLEDVARMMGFISAKTGQPLPATVQRHETGQRQPDLETIEQYRKVSGGRVTIDDWQELRRKTKRVATQNPRKGVSTDE